MASQPLLIPSVQIGAWPLMLAADTLKNRQAKTETENAFEANKVWANHA